MGNNLNINFKTAMTTTTMHIMAEFQSCEVILQMSFGAKFPLWYSNGNCRRCEHMHPEKSLSRKIAF